MKKKKLTDEEIISNHFREMGIKSWAKRKQTLLEKLKQKVVDKIK